MNSFSPTRTSGRWRAALSNLRRVLGLGWGQISRAQIVNVSRFYSMCPEEVAEFLGGRLLNFGYWTNETDQQAAALALVDEVAELAGICRGDSVLDAGCGFGVGAMRFHEKYHAGRVLGVNVTQCHLDHAQRAAAEAGLSDAVQFQFADATCLPFEQARFDRVIALESAFHFSPREAFFREAYRVLKPGGTLTIADVVPLKPQSGWMLKCLAAKLWLFPLANNYDAEAYFARLDDVGFSAVEHRAIGDHVYPGYVNWTMSPTNQTRLANCLGHLKAKVYQWQTRVLGSLSRRHQLEYFLIHVTKPTETESVEISESSSV